MSAITDFGFKWGNLEVVRVCSDPRGGRVLAIKTDKGQLEIRITPSGRFRIGQVERLK